MEKDYKISILLDYYGALLTDKQREMINYYYNDDLSLSEIAEITGITRQGVRDSIKRAESMLNEIEEKVGFFNFYSAKLTESEKIKNLCNDISSLDDVEKIKSKVKDIEEIIENQ